MRKSIYTLGALLAVALTGVAYAQWGTGCDAGQCPSGIQTQTSSTGWSFEEGWWYYREEGHMVEAVNLVGQRFWALDGQWVPENELNGVRRPHPRPRPAPKPKPADDDKPNFGIMREKMTPGVEKCNVNGQLVSKSKLFAEMAKGEDLTDDSALLRLTVLGPDSSRTQVLTDLKSNAALQPYQGKLVVQDYDAGHWAATKFSPGPGLTCVIQQPDGTVLARQDDYSDGAAGLAVNLAAAFATYDPAKPQDARNTFDPLKWANENPLLILGAGVVVLYLLNRKG